LINLIYLKGISKLVGEAIDEANFLDHKPDLIGILFWNNVAYRELLDLSLREQVKNNNTKIIFLF
jgi:hypothetical protein